MNSYFIKLWFTLHPIETFTREMLMECPRHSIACVLIFEVSKNEINPIQLFHLAGCIFLGVGRVVPKAMLCHVVTVACSKQPKDVSTLL